MTTAVQRRRGTTTEHASFTGLEGEISVNTTKETLVVHDGSTAGGFELARADGSNFVATSVDINGGTIDGTTIGASSASTGAFTTLTASGEITANGGIALGDNDKATFGASDDLQIYHDATNSYIDSNTGRLYVTAASSIRLTNSDNTENYARFNEDGSVQLYYDNVQKFATTATGIDVTGTATMDGLTVGSASGVFPSEVLQIRGNGGTSGYVNGFGLGASNAQLRVFADDTNNTLGSIKFDIRNRDRLLIEDNGDISFYEDTGTTPKLFWDASAESLGIGTSSPTALLHLSSTAPSILMQDSDGTGRSSINCDNGSLNFKFNSNNAVGTSVLTFSDFNTERMRIDSSGNVGIGVTPESTWDSGFNALQVGSRGALWSSTGASGTWLTRNAYYDGTNFKYVATDEASAYEQGADGSHRWSNASSGTADTTLTLTERMRIDSSGNVGIGTSSSTVWNGASGTKLLVGGASNTITSLQSSSTAINQGGIFEAYSTAVTSGSAALGSIAFLRENTSTTAASSYTSFFTNNGGTVGEKMRISSAGNVGIGTASPSGKVHIQTPAGTAPKYYIGQDATSAWSVGTPASTNALHFRDEQFSAIRMAIDASGNVLVGSSSTPSGSTDGTVIFASGTIASYRTGAAPAVFSRNASNGGDVVVIQQQGTTVGSIGTTSDRLTIGSGDTGLRFVGDADQITPWNTSTNSTSDNLLDLGNTNNRFKDLYLSGGVYLGGTGAANKLDDYEEGTWTPTLEGDTSGSAPLTVTSASYTKIGNTVHAYCYLSSIDLSADDIVGNMVIKGLPFNVSTNNLQSVAITYQALSATYLNMSGRLSSGFIRLHQDASNFSLARTDCVTTSGKVIMVGCTYPTNA